MAEQEDPNKPPTQRIATRVFLINEHKVKNHKDEIPAEIRENYKSKTEYYIHALITKFSRRLEQIEAEKPELANSEYKEVAKLVGSLESLMNFNNLLSETFGFDLDITDYCETIDKHFQGK